MDAIFVLPVLAWIVLQALGLWKLRGGWRAAALVPATAMGLAFGIAILGVLAGSDLAPIWVVLALPLCLAWLLVLWIVRGAAWALAR